MKRYQPGTLLIVIDAQKAFAHPGGSLARTYGYEEIRPGVEALAELHRFLAECPPSLEAVFVRSEYSPGQFTDGRLDHPLANLCVPTSNIDCEWADGLDVGRASRVVTKRQADAMNSPEYRDIVERFVALGAGTVCFAGFQLTTCVKATAISTSTTYRSQGVRVAVLKWLTGARASSYQSGHEPQSRVEHACSELRASGVDVLRQPDDFAERGGALWESLSESDRDGESALTDQQAAELDRRWAEHVANPGSAVPWAEVRRKLLRNG